MSMAGGVIPAKPRGIPGVMEALVLTACMALQPASLPASPLPLPCPHGRIPTPRRDAGWQCPEGSQHWGGTIIRPGGTLEAVGVGLANSNQISNPLNGRRFGSNSVAWRLVSKFAASVKANAQSGKFADILE